MENYQKDMEDKEEQDDNQQEPKKIKEIYNGTHFCVWGDGEFITIESFFNLSSVSLPIEVWEEMRTDFSILSMIDISGNSSTPPENLN